ncbi:MAG TPA: hypothetical protein VIJ62_14015 [Rhizomicrobium sp.]
MKIAIPAGLTRSLISKAMQNKLWEKGDRALYEFCRREPRHNDISSTVPKLWLIGRSYAAPIERGAGGGDLDKIYSEAAIKLKKSRLDEKLSRLKPSDHPDCELALGIHNLVIGCLPDKNGYSKCRRSVASKYLHFHRPEQFVLFDSRAKSAVAKFFVLEKNDIWPKITADRQYYAFVQKCEAIKVEIAEKFDIQLTNKELDKVLLRFSKHSQKA